MSDTLQQREDAPILDHDAREECSEPDCPCHEWSKRELTKETERVKGNQWAIDPYSSCEVIELDYAPPHLADRIAQTYGEGKEQRARRAEQIVTEHNQHRSLVAERERLLGVLRRACNTAVVFTESEYLDTALVGLKEIIKDINQVLTTIEQRSTSE